MTPPCPKCGATKTDPVKHGLKYDIVWAFGYRLQKCSRCRTPRYLPMQRRRSAGSSQAVEPAISIFGPGEITGGAGGAESPPGSKSDEGNAARTSLHEPRCCPACGSPKSHRTQRTPKERLMHRPPMLRCESCGMRFPHPGLRAEYFEPLKLLDAGEAVPPRAEDRRNARIAEERIPVTVPVAPARVRSSAAETGVPGKAEAETPGEISPPAGPESRPMEKKSARMVEEGAIPEAPKQGGRIWALRRKEKFKPYPRPTLFRTLPGL